jgi:ubiquinone/menaquinone biosynthesis C-methylase UbiE
MLPDNVSFWQRFNKKDARNPISKRILYGITAIITTLLLSGCFLTPGSSEDVAWLTDELHLKEGATVADIGAGNGQEALAIAKRVGEEGRVYATEIEGGELDELRKSVEESERTNVTVIAGDTGRTNLPAQCCDAIYLRKVYHHIEEPASMNADLFQSLKPGGRLAIIDFPPFGSEEEAGRRASNMSHGVSAETVVEELSRAGFTLLSSEDKPGRNYYVVMQKPEAGR